MQRLRVVLVALSVAVSLHAQQTTLLSQTYLVVTDRTSSGNNIFRYRTDGTLFDSFVRDVNDPEAIAFGPDQNLYISSAIVRTPTIDRYNGDTGNFIGDFLTSGRPASPAGVTFGPDGNLYVADRGPIANGPSRVLRYDGATGAFIDEFVQQKAGGYIGAGGIVFGPDGNLYATSGSIGNDGKGTSKPQILRFDGRNGTFKDVFVTTSSGGLENPFTLIFGPDGNLYVSSVTTNNVLRYDGKTGEFKGAFVTAGSGGLVYPTGMAFGPDGNFYVASSKDPKVAILRYNGITGAFINEFISGSPGGLAGPTDILFYTFESQIAATGHDTSVATDPAGNRMVVWTTDNDQIDVQAFDAGGKAVAAPHVVSASSDRASNPRVVAMSTNSYLVAWQAIAIAGKRGSLGTASGSRIVAQPISGTGVPAGPAQTVSQPPAGTGDGGPVITATKHHLKATVLWSRGDATGRGTGIVGRLIGLDASPAAAEVAISSAASGSSDEAPAVASDGNENVLAAWVRRRLDGTSTTLVAGATDGSLTATSAVNVLDDGANGAPGNPSIAENSSGHAVLVWSRGATQLQQVGAESASASRIVVVPVGGSATPSEPVTTVNADPNRPATKPHAVVSEGGAAGVVWQYGGLLGGQGVYGRVIGANGALAKTEFVVTDAAESTEVFGAPAVSVDNSGQLTISSHKTVSGAPAGVFARTRAAEVQPVIRRRPVKSTSE